MNSGTATQQYQESLSRECQWVFEQRKYLVVGSAVPLKIGAVFNELYDGSGTVLIDAHVVITEETNLADWMEQIRLTGNGEPFRKWARYYRCVAE